MVIFIHVVIALISVAETSFLLFSPSQKKLLIVYVLFGATVVSGTYLLFTIPSHMLQTCVEGLVYMGFVVGSIIYTLRSKKELRILWKTSKTQEKSM